MNIKCSVSVNVGISPYVNFIYFDAVPTSLACPFRGSTGLSREKSGRAGPTNPGHVGLFVGTCWAQQAPTNGGFVGSLSQPAIR